MTLSLVEWAAAIATLINVRLTVKADIRNFPWGIAAVLLYAWVFWQAKLYANLALQLLYYLPMSCLGWWVWLRTGPTQNDDLPIRRLSPPAHGAWAGATVVTAAGWGYLLAALTDGSVPYLDAATTAASITGQYFLTRKWLENWIYWIAVDVVYVFFLFPGQGLWISAGLYFILLVMAVDGLRHWLKAERAGAAHA